MIEYAGLLLSVAQDLGWLPAPPMFFGAAILEAYVDRAECSTTRRERRPTTS